MATVYPRENRRASLERCPTQGARGVVEDSAANGGAVVKNPLDSIWGTVIAGVVLTVILFYVARAIMPAGVA